MLIILLILTIIANHANVQMLLSALVFMGCPFPFFLLRSHFGSQVQHSSQTDLWGRPRVVVALLVLSCNELSHLQGRRLLKRLDARTVEGVGPIRQSVRWLQILRQICNECWGRRERAAGGFVGIGAIRTSRSNELC
jgi:hypothetical protein